MVGGNRAGSESLRSNISCRFSFSPFDAAPKNAAQPPFFFDPDRDTDALPLRLSDADAFGESSPLNDLVIEFDRLLLGEDCSELERIGVICSGLLGLNDEGEAGCEVC